MELDHIHIKGAREHWRKAIEKDPLVARFYMELGTSLIDDDEEWEEGERLLRLARELDPDDFYLERNLEPLLLRAGDQGVRGGREVLRAYAGEVEVRVLASLLPVMSIEHMPRDAE